VLSRILVALGIAAALVSGAAVVFLRSDFVANNLCAYAVATIEEATAATVQVSRCSVQPEQGKLTIEGLRVGDPGGRIDLKVARVFAQVKVRPLLQKVRLERLEVDHPQLRLALDQAGASPPSGGQCLPDVLDRFEFGKVKVRKASMEVRTSSASLAIPRASLAVKGRGSQIALSVSTRGGSLELPGRTVGLISSRTAGVVDLRGSGTVDLRRADVIGTEASIFLKGKLRNLCDPQIEVAANVRVDDLESATARLLPGALRGVKGAVSADATVSLLQGAPHVKGDLRLKGVALEGFFPGDGRLRFELTPTRVRVDRLEVPIGRGQVNGSLELSIADPALPLSADLLLRDMELAELLRKLGLQHAWVVLRASGRVQAKGTLSPFRLTGDTTLELADFAVLDRTYERRAQAQKMFEFARGKLVGEVEVDPEKVVAHGVTVEVGESRMQVESTFFTDLRKGMDLAARSEVVRLDDFRGHLGPLPARGTIKLAARVSGPYQALSIEGSAAVHGARFMDLSLGDVSTQVGFDAQSMKLAFADIRGRKDRSLYQGRLAVDFSTSAMPIDARLELPDAYAHDLVDLAVGLVPALSAVHHADDLDGHLAGVIDVRGPIAAPDGTASLSLDGVTVWGENFDRGVARLSLHGGEPRLQVEELALWHGDAELLVAGGFGPDWRLDFDARTESFTLADLDMATPAQLSGPLRATAHIGGSASHPLLDLALKFTEGMAGEADLGEGDLSLKLDGKALTWKGTVGTHAMQGQARLEGDIPYSCTATLRVPDLAQYVDLLAPEVSIQSGSLSASVELHGSLLKWRESAGTMTLSELRVVRSDLPFENDGPVQVTFGPEGVRTPRLALRAPYTTAQLSGGRGRDGKLDLRLGASIDGRVLPGLMPDVDHASGTYLVQATVGGTAKNPTVLGNIRIEDGAGSLRGLPVIARSLNGSISFSQDALVIDSLSGKLNNGDARVSGGIEMERMVPKKVDMSAHVSDVNVRFQESVGATVDGDLTLHGPPLEPVLGGNLILSHMKYTEDLEIEKSLLDFSRRPPTPKVLTKSAVVVRFDLDVHLSRGVRIENSLARTDLKGDLKITGTSRAIGLLGSVNTVHGTATFRGNEFQIEQGVLTFTDRQRIRPSFDLQASAQVREYKVRLHAFGTPGEPHLSLSSDPVLAEGDLGFLLTFGFVSQNLQQSTFSAADSGLAIGIEALNRATGFSAEVRRFIPKNAILRAPSIDFASEFSAATNRLEPMARFKSQLLTDRLDLNIMQGLTTRRYRGVISYQLSDAFSTRFQLDNEHATTGAGTDFGIDLHLKWEGD
jgi:translocation and assembly module TamB